MEQFHLFCKFAYVKLFVKSPILITASLLQIPQNLRRRQLARRAHDAAAGVRAGAALVVALDRRAVLVPAGRGAEKVHLRPHKLPGEDVALAQPHGALDVQRRDHLAMQNEITKVGKEFL